MGVTPPKNSPYWKQDELSKSGASFSISNHKILQLTSMSTCPPNLAYSFFTICEIIIFKVDKKYFFPYAKEGQQSFEGPKTTFSK